MIFPQTMTGERVHPPLEVGEPSRSLRAKIIIGGLRCHHSLNALSAIGAAISFAIAFKHAKF